MFVDGQEDREGIEDEPIHVGDSEEEHLSRKPLEVARERKPLPTVAPRKPRAKTTKKMTTVATGRQGQYAGK